MSDPSDSAGKPPKKLSQKALWLIPLIFVATIAVLRFKTGEQVALESIPLKELPTLSRAVMAIEKNYVDPQSVHPLDMIRRAARRLERQIPPLLVRVKDKGLEMRVGEKNASIPIPSEADFEDVPATLARLLGFLDLHYRGRPDDKDRLSLVLDGVVDPLDPHSNYLSPKVYSEFKVGTKGNFGGLGIVIGIRDGELTVISPLEGTPAFEAGIKAKDKIIQIGQDSTINMGLTEAVEKLRGPIGSPVSVVINRVGQATPLKFTLTRALIHIQSVAGKILPGKKIVWMKVKNFQEDTVEQFRKTLRGFESQGVKPEGLIIDLRNNPGGLLDQAVAMADFFLREGTIVKTVGAQGETIDTEIAGPGDEGEHYPLVAILNEGSASASEILAGALQMNNRAVVIGNRSFGKGSVQTIYDLKNGSAIKLTIAKYLTAKDQQVQSVGINPDVGLVPATIYEKDDDTIFDIFEDVKRRESDLIGQKDGEENDIGASQSNLPSPPLQMTYLSKEQSDEDATGKIELDDDFPVLLAEQILHLPESASLNRQRVVKALTSLLESNRKQEEGKIAASIEKLGIDWGAGDKKGKPSGVVTIDLLDDKGNPTAGLAAGESGFLRMTVENKSNAPFYRLLGLTKCEDPVFANLEFPFGRIDPQQKKSWKKQMKIPDFVSQRSIPVETEFHESFDRTPKASPFSMQVIENTVPHFEYSYVLEDNGKNDTSGNGNGKADPGETVGLLLTVKNTGKAEAKAPVVNIKNPEGSSSFIEKGHAEMLPLPPGGEAESELRFRVPKSAADKLSLDLLILDNHVGEELTDHLHFSLKNADDEPPQKTLQSPPVIQMAGDHPPLVSSGGSVKLKGTAVDDQELKHLSIFVGDEKVFYRGGSGGEKSLSFEAGLPLKKGANPVTVTAQDNRELITRKQWILWREK